jgi:hypothetical protein
MIKRIIMILLLCAGVSGVAVATGDPSPDYSESPEAMETLLNLSVVNVVLTVHQEWEESIELPVKWTGLRTFSKQMPGLYRDRLPVKDGWGEEFQCLAIEGMMVILSKGENGVHEFWKNIESIEDIETEMRREPFIGDDIFLWVEEDGEIVNAPKSKSDISKTAMADMRSIATAVESFAIDYNRYPTQGAGLAPLTVLWDDLEPLYIKVLPMLDPWGEPFLYWSDGTQYILISSGADKVFDRTYPLYSEELKIKHYRGLAPDFETDLVFINGQFAQWHLTRR